MYRVGRVTVASALWEHVRVAAAVSDPEGLCRHRGTRGTMGPRRSTYMADQTGYSSMNTHLSGVSPPSQHRNRGSTPDEKPGTRPTTNSVPRPYPEGVQRRHQWTEPPTSPRSSSQRNVGASPEVPIPERKRRGGFPDHEEPEGYTWHEIPASLPGRDGLAGKKAQQAPGTRHRRPAARRRRDTYKTHHAIPSGQAQGSV